MHILAILLLCVSITSCKDSASESSRSSSDSSPNQNTKIPAPIASPTAAVPDLFDFRVKPAAEDAPEIYLASPIPGRFVISHQGQVVADERGEKPIAYVNIHPSESAGDTWIEVRFEPADGSPGTQRLLHIPNGSTKSIFDLMPPGNDQSDWIFKPRNEDTIASSELTDTKAQPMEDEREQADSTATMGLTEVEKMKPSPVGLSGYTARLSAQDRLNSNGTRLTELSAILRQDRANYHRFNKKDAEDGDDPWFNTTSGRSFFDSAQINVVGNKSDLNRLLQEDVVIHVEKVGTVLRIRLLDK
jgi:hypothetical protein